MDHTTISELDELISRFHDFRRTSEDGVKGLLVLCGNEETTVLSRATEIYTTISGNEVLASDINTTVALLRTGEVSKLLNIIEEEEAYFTKRGKVNKLHMFFYNLHYLFDNEKDFKRVFEERLENSVFYEDLEDKD